MTMSFNITFIIWILAALTYTAKAYNKEPLECTGRWGNLYNGTCYRVYAPQWELLLDNREAHYFCNEMGAELTSIDSIEEVSRLGIYINNTLGITGMREFSIHEWMGHMPVNSSVCNIMSNWDNRLGDTSIYTRYTKPCIGHRRNWICKARVEHVRELVERELMRDTVRALSRQLVAQQLYVEERIRSDGDSGLKQIRQTISGTRTYHSETHTGNKVAAIHDHSNNIRTVGLGEFVAVLNGVEFRTRHNDYRLYMPSRTSTDYGAMEDVPFPDVPPQVLAKGTVQEEIDEMKEWFRAWANQDTSIRDYRPYFKPVICYLEGMWTNSGDTIDEPFFSDRHSIDASTWDDLLDKVRFTSYNGRKSLGENYSYLPIKVQKLLNGTFPVFAQWNYRIACHPISRDVPLNRFRLVDDLSSRMAWGKTFEDHGKSRAARYELNPYDEDSWKDDERIYWPRTGVLDKLMAEIPGRDNYPANHADDTFRNVAKGMDNAPLNAGYYHRWFKVSARDAMGVSVRSRGFSDNYLFMAMNNQSKVASMELDDICKITNGEYQCQDSYSQRWSYAIPLEIIYLTPLNAWNPYKLQYKGDAWTAEGRTVEANGRNGGNTPDKAYAGTNSRVYYNTPQEFFTGDVVGSDPADTARGSVGVLDPQGVVRPVRASGVRVFFPNIQGVGTLRQRYPIMPIHGEGSALWKELEAVKDILFNPSKYQHMYPGGGSAPPTGELKLQVSYTTQDPPGPHAHIVTLTEAQAQSLHNGQEVTGFTSEDNSHNHEVKIRYNPNPPSYYITSCDGLTYCWDGHAFNPLTRVESNMDGNSV